MPHHKGRIQIGVIGSECATTKALDVAFEVGREIAKRGAVLVCGGRSGIMERACAGAKSENGLTVGILPSASKEEANEYVDIRIPTSMGYARNQLVVLSSDAVIVVGGEAGTLSEICFAWIYGKPTVAIGGTGGYADEYAGKAVDSKRQDKIMRAKSAKEAVELVFKLVGEK